jgi:2,6-dihydroxypseudooxynicotine hydrolase
MRPAGERVAIPFEAKTMFGVLRKPIDASGRQPILIMAPGLDSTKEELHAYEEPFLARGIAILAIDGPGQGEAEYDIPICGDYERAARAACDWIEKRADLDASKIAMWGVSLGGYYAPRATAYEKRIKACIGISGPFEWKEIWKDLPGLTREAFRVRSHCKTEAECRDALDEGRGAEDRLPDLHRHRAPGPARSRIARRKAGEERHGPGGVGDRGGRRTQCQQPSLPL